MFKYIDITKWVELNETQIKEYIVLLALSAPATLILYPSVWYQIA